MSERILIMTLRELLSKLMPLTEGYYAERDLVEFISPTSPWIMFPYKEIKTKKQGENAPYPNVYVGHESDSFSIGIAYSNYGALEWILSINEPGNEKSKGKLEGLIRQLPDRYSWTIDIRTRRAKTEFEEHKSGLTKDIDFQAVVSSIKELIPVCKAQASSEDEKGKITWKAPSFNLACITVQTLPECEKEFGNLFGILLQLFEVKTLPALQQAESEKHLLLKELESYTRHRKMKDLSYSMIEKLEARILSVRKKLATIT